jgi:tetratricopeptide (TPR) repeat protein
MIARDEEKNLPRSLGPLMAYVSEAVVLDTGSQDQTPQLAASLGARVYELPWPGDFAAARNQALARMTTDYALWLDADNSLDPASLARFQPRLDPDQRTIYLATERVIPQGERVWQKRILPRRPEARWEGRIHEQLIHPPDFPILDSQLVIDHWGYAEPGLAKIKGERNLALLSQTSLTEAHQAGDYYHLYQTGRTLSNLRRPEEAIPWLSLAAENPTNPALASHSLILLAQAHQSAGRWERARAVLTALTQKRPDYGPGHYFLGRLLAPVEPELAIAELTAALELGLNDPGWGAHEGVLGYGAAYLLGRLWVKAGDQAPKNSKGASGHPPDQSPALKYFRLASSFNPQRPEPKVELAGLLGATGDKTAALEISRQVLVDFPGLRSALSLWKKLGGDEVDSARVDSARMDSARMDSARVGSVQNEAAQARGS